MANKFLLVSVLCAVVLKGAAFAGPIPPGPSGNYVNNSASAQSAQFNVTSGTVRGALTAGSLVIPAINVATATATQHIGGGIGLTNLNPAEVKAGTIPASVVWNGAPIGVAYGGTGQDFSAVTQGKIPYFSGTGVMGTVPAGVANQVLQSGGPSGAPTFTGAPAVLGTNITAIPPTNLAAGTLPVNVPASSITVTGVIPGVYGGPTQSAQITVRSDGRIGTITQSHIPGISSTTVMYDQSYTWTKYQNFLSSVTLPIIDGPTTVTDNLIVGASVQANIAQVNSVDFIPVTAPAYREGRIYYDSTAKTLVVFSDTSATSLNVGEEMWTMARNNTVSIIPDGSVVYITGALGQMPTIALARADSFATSRLIGVTTMDFPINGNGKVTVFGKVHGLNTVGLTEGNVLYLSTFTAGALSLTRPSSPNYDARVGLVLKENVSDGEIHINPDMSIRLGMGAANQILGMNAAGSEEQYKTLRSTNISIANSAGFIDLAVVSVPATAVDLSTVTTALALRVAKSGDTMTGQLTILGSTLTIANAESEKIKLVNTDANNAANIRFSAAPGYSEFLLGKQSSNTFGLLAGGTPIWKMADNTGDPYMGVYENTPKYRLDVNGGGHFTSSMTVDANYYGNGATLTGVVKTAGDTMTGPLSLGTNSLSAGSITGSSLTVTGNTTMAGVNAGSLTASSATLTGGIWQNVVNGQGFYSNLYAPAAGYITPWTVDYNNSGVGAAPAYHVGALNWVVRNGGGGELGLATSDTAGGTPTNKIYINSTDVAIPGSAFSVGGSTLMVAGGKVGIGVSPTKTLDIQSSSVSFNLQSTEGINKVSALFVNTGGTGYLGLENSVGNSLLVNGLPYAMVMGPGGAKALQLGTDDTVRMTVLPTSGNVGIGTTAPITKLEVSTGTLSLLGNAPGALYLNAAGANSGYIQVGNDSGAISYLQSSTGGFGRVGTFANQGFQLIANSAPFLTGLAGGNVGIGTVSPGAKLDVVGAIASAKNKLSNEGGYLLMMVNNTGVTIASGTVVMSTGTTVDFGFKVNTVGNPQSFGAVYGPITTDAMGACADGASCWVCVSGFCAVNIDSVGCATRGLWMGASNTNAGTAECVVEPNPASQHDREIGHNVKAAVAGQAWGVMQFGR